LTAPWGGIVWKETFHSVKRMDIKSHPPSLEERTTAESVLEELIPEAQWAAYEPVLEQANAKGLSFAVGGGIAFSLYAGHRRNTKDLDLFVLASQHEPILQLMHNSGFEEYTEFPYDRSWSYRGVRNGFILDILWRMLNDRAPIDESWMTRGWEVETRGVPLRLLPVEELIWTKLYIVHRDRCDWPDILVLLGARGEHLDWKHLLWRVGDDAPLLGSVLSLFRWMCPGKAAGLPSWVWNEVGLAAREPNCGLPEVDRERIALIQKGNWYPL
jgi:hypothetical protein